MSKYIKMGKRYSKTSDMIKEGILAGFKHIGGHGFACIACKNKTSVRKFLMGKSNETLYACPKCGARWGSLIKEDHYGV